MPPPATPTPAIPTPAISVLLPVYNAERWVAEALESVLRQTCTDFELLVTDDGSTDGSPAILRRFAARDARIRVRSRPNAGLVATLNEQIAEARGEFAARMDADDVCAPERFERQLAFLRAHPEIVAVSSAYALIDPRGRHLTVLRTPAGDSEIQANMLQGHSSLCHPAAMIRLAALRAVGGYDPETYPAEDLDLFLRLGERGKLANLQESLLSLRLLEGSISGSNVERQRLAARTGCERAWKRRGITGTFQVQTAWRPEADRSSRQRFFLQYGWWAYQSKQYGTAAHYALRAAWMNPFRLAPWKLLAISFLRKG